jgi:hypothetical protein
MVSGRVARHRTTVADGPVGELRASKDFGKVD